MHITLENLSGLERKLNIEIPAEDVESKVKTKLREIASKAKMPGFRPGKIPFDVVQKRYTDAARSEVLENLIRDTYSEALKQEKINPAGFPNIKITSSKPNEKFVYSATFEVYPEVKLNDFKEIEVEKITAKVADEDVDAMLEKLRKKDVLWQEITDSMRKSQVGDQLTIDFTAKPIGADKDAKSKTEENVKFVLGDGFMWADFEQPLYGISIGEEKKYILQLPATHVDKELAGNKAEFTIKVRKVCEPILPVLDDKFAEKMNIKEGGLEKLKSELREHMERELQGTLQDMFKNAIMDKLLEANPIEVPKVLVENELGRLAEKWQKRFASSGNTKEKATAFPRDNFEHQAKRSVSLGFLLSTVVSEHKIKVDSQDVRKKVEDLVSMYYEDKDKAVDQYLSDRRRVSEIESLLLEEKVTDYLASQVNVVEKALSYKDALAKK